MRIYLQKSVVRMTLYTGKYMLNNNMLLDPTQVQCEYTAGVPHAPSINTTIISVIHVSVVHDTFLTREMQNINNIYSQICCKTRCIITTTSFFFRMHLC